MSIYLMMALAVVAALLFLNQSTRQKIVPDGAGRFHLRMNKLYSLAGIFSILLGLGLSITGLMREISLEMIGLVLIVLGITWGSGIYCLLYYYNHRVTFDDTAMTVTDVFGKTAALPWQDISSARTAGMSGLIIHGPDRQVKLHPHLVGLSQLQDKLKEKTGLSPLHPRV